MDHQPISPRRNAGARGRRPGTAPVDPRNGPWRARNISGRIVRGPGYPSAPDPWSRVPSRSARAHAADVDSEVG
jgi:hypothetical protein